MTGGESDVHANRQTVKLLPAPSFAKPDIVRRFLAFAQSASAERRAAATSALARAYLHSGLAPAERARAELALIALLDDPSALVRRAVADALAGARDAPRPLILMLAAGPSDAAAAVLGRSPVLTDADLVDCAATGDVIAQTAIARRPDLKPGAIAALVETGQREAVVALVGNRSLALNVAAFARILERFGEDFHIREAMLDHPALPPGLRARIVAATANDLSRAASPWLARDQAERVARDARDQAICAIAFSCTPHERADLVRSLRACGALTPALLLRSLMGGDRGLFAGALAELSGAPIGRVVAFIRDPRGEGFAALALKSGFKSRLLPAFRAALAAIKADRGEPSEAPRLTLVQSVIDECERRDDPALDNVRALLWRFAAQAARAEAAGFARKTTASTPFGRLPRSLDLAAANDDASVPPKVAPGAAARVELQLALIAALDEAA